jgi:ankyrin repeat protein
LGAVDCVLVLLEHGGSPNATTVEQYTPLHIAAKEGHEEVVQVLLDRGAEQQRTTSVLIDFVMIARIHHNEFVSDGACHFQSVVWSVVLS